MQWGIEKPRGEPQGWKARSQGGAPDHYFKRRRGEGFPARAWVVKLPLTCLPIPRGEYSMGKGNLQGKKAAPRRIPRGLIKEASTPALTHGSGGACSSIMTPEGVVKGENT